MKSQCPICGVETGHCLGWAAKNAFDQKNPPVVVYCNTCFWYNGNPQICEPPKIPVPYVGSLEKHIFGWAYPLKRNWAYPLKRKENNERTMR